MRYYEDSKIFSLLREKVFKLNKPEYASARDWDTWEKETKKNHKIKYWLCSDLPSLLEKPAEYLIDPLYAASNYLYNRFVSKSHVLETGLKYGEFYEFDTKLLHGMFNALVDFVECEQAWHQQICSDNDKYNLPWWAKVKVFRFKKWRCKEAGIDYLLWASTLKFNEDYGVGPEDEDYGKFTPQAEAALETLALYNWWKYLRPLRPSPFTAAGLDEFDCRMSEKHEGFNLIFDEMTQSEREEMHGIFIESTNIEEQQYLKDTNMMQRLIKIRGSLWT